MPIRSRRTRTALQKEEDRRLDSAVSGLPVVVNPDNATLRWARTASLPRSWGRGGALRDARHRKRSPDTT
jgi:hypothetical protein